MAAMFGNMEYEPLLEAVHKLHGALHRRSSADAEHRGEKTLKLKQ